MEFVIDANVAVKWFLPEADSDKAELLLKHYLDYALDLTAPDLIIPEVTHTLWKRSAVRKEISLSQALESCIDFVNLQLPLQSCSPIAERALNLAAHEQHSVYDSLYLVLALERGCQFVTADQPIVNKLAGKFPQIHWLGNLKSSGGRVYFA